MLHDFEDQDWWLSHGQVERRRPSWTQISNRVRWRIHQRWSWKSCRLDARWCQWFDVHKSSTIWSHAIRQRCHPFASLQLSCNCQANTARPPLRERNDSAGKAQMEESQRGSIQERISAATSTIRRSSWSIPFPILGLCIVTRHHCTPRHCL